MNLAITTTSARTWKAVKAHYIVAIAGAALAISSVAGAASMSIDWGGGGSAISRPVQPAPVYADQQYVTYYLVESTAQRDLVLAEATREAEDQAVYSPDRHWKFAVLLAGTAEDEAVALSTIGEAQVRWAQAGASGLEVVDRRSKCGGC